MFSPYPWHQMLWRLLTQAVKKQSLSHALLLHGISGLGKTRFARALAAYILCESKKDLIACGVCRSCVWFKAGTHPDFLQLSLTKESQVIKIDALRDLIQSLEKAPYRSAYQVALINGADKMSQAAANALLKTLEEPPGRVVILLVTDCLSILPATVVSRCQRILLSLASDQSALTWLRSKIQEPIDVSLLLKLAEYAPLRAVKYAGLQYFEWRHHLLEHLCFIQQQKITPVDSIEVFLKRDIHWILNILMTIIADMLCLKHGALASHLLHYDCVERLCFLLKPWDIFRLHGYFQYCQQALSASVVPVNLLALLENVFIEYGRCCYVC